jgi:ferredoxin-NADP reductase
MDYAPASASVLAAATTVHLALAALRNHRRPGRWPFSSLAVVSALLAATPWLFPSIVGLAVGLLVHVLWYVVCERFVQSTPIPAPAPARPASKPSPNRPAMAAAKPPSHSSRPRGFVDAPVLAVLDESRDIRTFRLKRPDGFEFKPGQFLTVRVRADGREHARCYSISSPPEVTGYLEISVKRQGTVSNTLHATLRPGALLSVKAPAGVFTYPDHDDRPLVLIAGGVGITPLISMARHAVMAEPGRPVTLLYSARDAAGLAFHQEIAHAADRHPSFRVFYALTGGTDRPGIHPRRIDEALLRGTVPDLAHSIVLMCGPQSMIDGMRVLLPRLGVPADCIRFEVFQAAIAASAARAGGVDGDVPQAPPRKVNGRTHQMRCARSGHEITIGPTETLLEAAETAGIDVQSLCRAGVCGTCRTKVIDGDVDCASDLLDDLDRREGFVLACVASAHGDCTVDL